MSSESSEENIKGECEAHSDLKQGESSWFIKTLFQGTMKTNYLYRCFSEVLDEIATCSDDLMFVAEAIAQSCLMIGTTGGDSRELLI